MHYACGYTTGVFDLFHVGHLELLRLAKEHCDFLIVGVSSDQLVMQVKKRAPVIPCKERMEIVSAICYVDKVVIQRSTEKLEDWEKYHFDVVFHGNDWQYSAIDIHNAQVLSDKGVDFVYFERGRNRSTTEIRERIRSFDPNEE